MNRLEGKIRDYLKDHLDLIEDNLTYIDNEYPIKSPYGAGGRIDILAKDRYGQFVIIEIKRSDQAARQTLNELHKYSALFRVNQGLDEKNLRLMVVSTEWHELLLPLSEFAKNTDYHVEGFLIEATDVGVVSKVSLVELKALQSSPESLKVCRYHELFLFKNTQKRDRFQKGFSALFKEVYIEDFFFLHCDHDKSDKRVIHPCGLYICISSPLDTMDKETLALLKEKIDWDTDLDPLEQNLFAALNQPNDREYDEFEIGCPEKLSSLAHSWPLLVSERHGRFLGSSSLKSDSDLIKLAMAIEGGSDSYYGKTISPKFTAAWVEFKKNLLATLIGYTGWEDIIKCLLSEIETTSSNSSISVISYTPANFLLSLYSLTIRDDFKFFPYFEIIIDDPSEDEVRTIFSLTTWNGRVIDQPPKNIISSIFSDTLGWMTEMHFNQTYIRESRVISAHNLKLALVELKSTKQGNPQMSMLGSRKNQIKRKKLTRGNILTIQEFKDSHSEYLSMLAQEIEQSSTGLREYLS